MQNVVLLLLDPYLLIVHFLCVWKKRFYYAIHQTSPCKFRAIKRNVFLVLLLSVYVIHIHILMMPRRKLTLEQKWQVIGMRNTGLSLHRIADQFGVSHQCYIQAFEAP